VIDGARGQRDGRAPSTGSTGRLGRALRALAALPGWIRKMRMRLHAWRRIHFTSGGLAFTLGTFAVGFAALNTGNNLLYLLFGAMIGFIAVSSWLSEQTIRGIHVERELPRAVTVGQDFQIGYHVRNAKRRLPSLAVEIGEKGLPRSAFLARIEARGDARARSVNRFKRRGTFPLGTVTLSTAFPFGLFRKERDLEIQGELVVWPRHDRPVPNPSPGGGRMPRIGVSAAGSLGVRGEYRGLRGYRPGDDPRDIHWRSSARLREPVVREYERDGAETRWICLDTRAEPGEPAEVAVEVAASLAARAASLGRPFALVAGTAILDPGEGPGQMERILDALARVDFRPDAPRPVPPVSPADCVLVSVDGGAAGFGDVLVVGGEARLDPEGVLEE